MRAKTPAEITAASSLAGVGKAVQPVWRMLLTGCAAGIVIGLAAAVTNTAAHSLGSVSAMRIVSGLLFAFGLGIVILLGAELYTGNVLILLSVLDRRVSVPAYLRNLLFIWLGNGLGGIVTAYGCVLAGQFQYSDGQLAVYTVKLAVAKCSIAPEAAVVAGIFCNLLVCMGVLLATGAGDSTGKLLGAFAPVAFFVICGFEHCVANMYYIPAGLFAMARPDYAALVREAGIDTASLTWFSFLVRNLLPVTVGNAAGGVLISLFMRRCHPPSQQLGTCESTPEREEQYARTS